MTQFRPMRRKAQLLPDSEAIGILQRATSGVLCVLGDDGYPYGVPLSHVYIDGDLYFHSALEGHKIDAIRSCNKASFTVIEKDDVVAEEFTTYFRSVIVFGQVNIVEDAAEKRCSANALGERFNPDAKGDGDTCSASGFERMHMIRFHIEHMTGKEAIELVRQR